VFLSLLLSNCVLVFVLCKTREKKRKRERWREEKRVEQRESL
jgi:hypothetical protein